MAAAQDYFKTFIGPLLIGSYFNVLLYGALVVQAYVYFNTRSKDSIYLKLFIVYLLVVETCSAGFDIGIVYEPVIIQKLDPALVGNNVPMMFTTIGAVTTFVSTPVQIYLALRLRKVLHGQSPILPCIIVALSLFSLAGGLATSISTASSPHFSMLKRFQWAPGIWLASSAVADVLVTGGLVWFLHKNKSGFTTSDSVVHKIMILSIQTGALTALAASADFAVFLLDLHGPNFIWDLALAKLYTNGLLSTLNARTHWNALIDSERRDNENMSFIDVEKAIRPDVDGFKLEPAPAPKHKMRSLDVSVD